MSQALFYRLFSSTLLLVKQFAREVSEDNVRLIWPLVWLRVHLHVSAHPLFLY